MDYRALPILLIIVPVTYGDLVLFEYYLCAEFCARTIAANERYRSDVISKEINISQLITKYFIIFPLKYLEGEV